MATERLPPPAPRSDPLQRLRRDLWFARDAGETRRAAEIMRQIGRLRAAPAGEPKREDTAAHPPQRETTTAKPRPATARKPKPPRSPRVPRN